MRKTLFALLIVMLALSACVSNKTFKAQQAKVQIMEARQNNQDAELEMARKDIINNREKLDQLIIRLNSVDEQLQVLEPMQDEIVNSATALVNLQGEVAAISGQLNEAIAANAKLEQKLTALTTDTNETFDAYSDYLKQMKDSQSGFATKEEVAQLTEESTRLAQVLDDLTAEVESIALFMDEQDAILEQLGEFAENQAAFNEGINLEKEAMAELQASQTTLTEDQQKSAAQEKEAIWTEITRIRGELTKSQNELTAIRQTLSSDVEGLKKDRTQVMTEMSELRERVYAVNSDLTSLTTDLQSVITKERAAAEKRRLEAINKQYKAALAEYNRGRHENSIVLFEEFLKANPDCELSPNAYYWIGENYYSAGNYPKALRQFQEVVDRYQGHDKAWDAQLKIGLTYFQMQDYESTYNELMVIKNYNPSYPQMKIVDKYLKRI
ncbi:MAG TPA: tetratricopeptide repeat protein [Candidatus Syntrophosphaera sp.]|jgi:TolA-binding protein|nr:tetratricopeptide repeat protein [Candidatus Cloacimonadota bacterium]HOR02390.1 tetratricopeptide repeat protein [Candidatus Syntrophosphaera sp.]HPB43133.1 tetratricopeptide repeat protein [Candidatus Syntrophosphaera sp.]HPK82390.1 tetratricopeptide repeat protein [Candidatus Syntrophosphaera sp.]HQG93544.1 tetratricopeptide repeat protein [Candidatus Syntrophosphaera sp.]